MFTFKTSPDTPKLYKAYKTFVNENEGLLNLLEESPEMNAIIVYNERYDCYEFEKPQDPRSKAPGNEE